MTAKKKPAPKKKARKGPKLHQFRPVHGVEGEQPDECAVKGCGKPGAALVHRGGKAR